jgi:hypothetical protein
MQRTTMLAFIMCFVLAACGRMAALEQGLKEDEHGFYVGPVLQNGTETTMGVMWETGIGKATVVEYGPTPRLGLTATGSSRRGSYFSEVHHVTMTGLRPDTRYFYRVGEGDAQSPVLPFRTPPRRGEAKPFRFAVYSDCQQNPGVHERIVERGVYGALARGESPVGRLAFVLVAGDTVQTGDDYWQYKERLFDPIESVAPSVPYYAAIGNHEDDSPHYFDYLDLPKNGTPGFEEHWYSFDYANVHVIGLDTNTNYRNAAQLAWLDQAPAAACGDDRTRFVFAYFHHPWKSELWLPGEEPYSGRIVQRLEAALTACGKSGAYLFGHTHGYSRGQSKDHALYHVNVGTAGGEIDRWAAFAQRDYEEFQKTFDEYGAVIFDVNPAGEVGFVARRLTFGDDERPKDGEVQDEFYVYDANVAPATPALESVALSADRLAADLRATDFADPEQDRHLESEWQVATTPDFATPTSDAWLRYENIYMDRDTMAGADIRAASLPLPPVEAGAAYARVRYRDAGLAWSPWSEAKLVRP